MGAPQTGATSPGLDGTGRVGDDLYLLAHNDVTGKPYVQPRALGLGLAGGLLAELVLAGAVSADRDEIVAAGHRAPGDELARRVLGRLATEHERHPVRDWLLYLARTAADDVAGRLAHSGYLVRAGGWPRRPVIPSAPFPSRPTARSA